ncbi:MFS transporter [Halobacillus aidingensis]|uniref:Predicted arabinose efflux permease, MFS family n=1 Tax=Halobacillus aidingensis TaxID=240303 RepID=A0A1H0GEX0_HALAD|nr:MFS transporter [Halobacillus aidingensis]SDO05351.1 Predicted arabinose efflux permease, MFS family [Halobacillus aidingensis]
MIRTHSYRYLFYSGIVNGIGDRFSQVAVLTLLLQLTGSGLAVGAALGLRVVPYLLLSPLGGRLADRFHKKWLLVLTDVFRIPFALSFLLVDTKEMVWLVFTAMFVLACGEAVYQPVRKSLIATIVEKEDLVKVNGWEQLLLGVVLIAGSITGGVVAYVFGTSFAFWLNGLSFVAAAVLVLPLKRPLSSSHFEKEETKKRVHWEGWMIFVVVIQLVGATMDGAFNVLISVYGAETFHLGELGVGFLYGALGTGLVASFFFSSKIKTYGLPLCLALLIVEGMLHLLASRMANFPGLWMTFVSIALIGGVWGALLDAFLMKNMKAEDQGRVFGWMESWTNVQLGLMMFASGWFLDVFSARTLGLWGGGIGIIGGVWLLFFYFQFRKRQAFTSVEEGSDVSCRNKERE